MKIGDVFFWESDQAIGYDLRNKYHVYITEGDWRTQGEIFLFVNKSNASLGYRITNPPYFFMTKFPVGYISCTGVIPVPTETAAKFGPPCGKILDTHLRELRDFVAASDVMSEYDIQLVCKAIDDHLK